MKMKGLAEVKKKIQMNVQRKDGISLGIETQRMKL